MDKKKILFITLGLIISVAFIYSVILTVNKMNSSTNNSNINTSEETETYNNETNIEEDIITSGGTYTIEGESNPVVINTDEDVKLVLNGVTITNNSGPAIYVENAKSVSIEINGDNTITSKTTEELDGAIYSTEDLIINGNGKLNINSNYGGIVSDNTLVIESGTYILNTDADGIHADAKVEINEGTFTINAEEGIEATYVQIDGGDITIKATDDGINASAKSDLYTPTIEINGGSITIDMAEGDTDAIDSNGNIIVNGGTINITAQSVFDFDGNALYNGGTITANGQKLTSIQNSMMGGGMQRGR